MKIKKTDNFNYARSSSFKVSLLILLPFLVTGIERMVIVRGLAPYTLPETSVQLFKIGSITLLLFAVSSYFGKTYGFEITKKLKNILASMFLALIAVSYLFLYSLQSKGFLDNLAVVHLVNWILTVLREEFVLRGIVQTESGNILKGSLLKIPKSIWFTTFVFSIWHLVNLNVWPWHIVASQMLSCIPSGVILGLIREKTENTLLTYLLHIVGDLLFFSGYLIFFGKLFFNLF